MGHGYTKLVRIEMVVFRSILETLPSFFSNLYQFISKCHLHSWKIILSYYVAVILQMKDSCSAN